MKYYPLSEDERFDVAMALFRGKVTDECYGIEDVDEALREEFGIEPEAFDRLVGKLVTLTPVVHLAPTGGMFQALGVFDLGTRFFTEVVKREVQP